MPEPTDQIPRQEVVDLLAAIVEVLDVPTPERYTDSQASADVLSGRTAFVRGALAAMARGSRGASMQAATATVREAAVVIPVTYQQSGA